MKRTSLLSLALVLLASGVAVRAQQPPPPGAPTAPPAAPLALSTSFFPEENFLGIVVEEITRENAGRYRLSGEPRGVGVRSVVKGSPAERAGLREGDVVLRYDGEAVTSVRKLNRLIAESAPEHGARLTIARGGSEQEVSATLGRHEGFSTAPAAQFGFDADALRSLTEGTVKNSEQLRRQGEDLRRQGEELRRKSEELRGQFGKDWPNNPGGFAFAPFGGRRIGVSTTGLGRQLADYFGVSHGVLVNSVEENSPAAKAGLRAGDVITEVDGEKVEDAGDLSGVIGRKEQGDVTLTIVRDRKSRTLRVTPERRQTPQGFYLNPGNARLIPPVAAAPALRQLVAPRALTAPRVQPLPRVRSLPGRVL